MLENGSGEVLMAARVVALAACAVAASVPPSSAAIVVHGGRVATEHAGGQRRAGRDADEGVHRVPQRVETRNLVGEELDHQHQARRAEHQRVLQHLQAGGQRHPAQPAGQRR